MRHIIPISGKDSLATALFQIAKEPNLHYEFMFNPTGAELPEVFEWIGRVENYLGKDIIQVGVNLESLIKNYNGFLPSRQNRYCTRQSKIEPMEKYIGKDECFIYYGIRADEDRVGYNNSTNKNIIPKYPLKEAGINLAMVYQIINKAGLKPPVFRWESVYQEVCKRIGGESVLKSILSEYQIDILFSWRTRANCYFCFNQRKYEWVGLYEHHPELFKIAEEMEHNGSEYFWNGKDYPLTKVIERKEITKENRIKAIVKFLHKLQASADSEDDKEFVDILSITSCGLLCGK